MVDIKKKIASLIEKEINIDVYNYIKEIDDSSKGDYVFPCFSLSKEWKNTSFGRIWCKGSFLKVYLGSLSGYNSIFSSFGLASIILFKYIW